MRYQASYNRCVFDVSPVLPIVFLVAPLVAMALMYLIIGISIVRNKISVGRLLITTTAILLTGVIVVLPTVLMVTAKLKFSYKAAKIFTVTLYHSNCIFNPIIYYCANPRIAPQIQEQASIGTRSMKRQLTRTLTRTVSGFNLVTYTTVESENKNQRSSTSK